MADNTSSGSSARSDITVTIGADTFNLQRGLDEASKSIQIFDSILVAKAGSYVQYAYRYSLLAVAIQGIRPAIQPVIPLIAAATQQFGLLRIASIAAVAAFSPWHAGAMAAGVAARGIAAATQGMTLSFTGLGTAIAGVGVVINRAGKEHTAMAVALRTTSTTLAAGSAQLTGIFAGLGAAMAAVGLHANRMAAQHAATGTVLTATGRTVASLGQRIGALSVSVGGLATFWAHSLMSLANWHVALMAVGRTLGILIDGIRQASQALKSLNEVGRLRDQLRTSFEYADQLSGAFRRMGISTADLNSALSTLSMNIQTGLGDRTNAVTTLFRGLGIATTDASGRLRNMGDIFVELSTKLNSYANDGRRLQNLTVALNQELAQRFLPVIPQIATQLHALTVAQGQTFTVEAYQRMKDHERLNKDLDKLYKAVVDTVANGLVWAYNQWQRVLVNVLSVLKPVVDEITKFLEWLNRAPPNTWSEAIRETTADITRMETELKSLQETEAQLRRGEGWLAGLRTYQPQIDRINEALTTARTRLEELRRIGLPQGWAAVIRPETEQGPVPLPPSPTVASIQAAEQAAQEHADRLVQIATRAARLQLDSYLDMVNGQRTIFDEMNFQVSDHATRVEEATRRIMRAYADGAIQQEQIARIKRNLALQEQRQILDTATMAASTITSLFPKSKAAGIAAAVINTAVGITNALSTGIWPWNYIQAGLIAATGAAQIATIRSTSLNGGSTPSVGGGGSGSGGDQATPQTARMLTISGLSPEGRYSGNSVMGLISQINEEVQNGAVLISTSAMRQSAA